MAATSSASTRYASSRPRAGVAAGERVLIVTDTAADAEIVSAMAGVLGALGASVVTVQYRPAELPGDEPPAAVSAAMLEADVIFELTSVFVGSCPARRAACERGLATSQCPALPGRCDRQGRSPPTSVPSESTRSASRTASTAPASSS